MPASSARRPRLRAALLPVLLASTSLGACAGQASRGAPAAARAPAAPAPRLPLALAPGEEERAHYRIEHALLGEVGRIEITTVGRGQPHTTHLHATGRGSGDVLGFGRREQRIATTFALDTNRPDGWQIYRKLPGRELTDIAHQAEPGRVAIVRQRRGQPDEPAHFSHDGAVYDPLGLLLALRARPPAAEPEVRAMLDGQAYFRVTTRYRGPQPLPIEGAPRQHALRIDAQAEPLDWSGSPAGDRAARRFVIWMSDDDRRVPLALVADTPMGEVRALLLRVERSFATAVAMDASAVTAAQAR